MDHSSSLSTASTLLLGLVAGSTIVLGLPIARLRQPALGLRVTLNAVATGILIFLLWDVLGAAVDPVETAMTAHHWGSFSTYAVVAVLGLVLGLMSLVYYDRWMARRGTSEGPGTASITEVRPGLLRLHSPAYRLSLLIAVGIGLHNFAEGLAIGQSAASGEVRLALLLIIGFGLHNATEGFGIVGPLAGNAERPSWGYLGLLGLIGGGPTFLGTILGRSVVNHTVSIAFLTLAAGSILYVVIAMLGVAQRLGRKELLCWGLLLGLVLGFATDLVVTAAGV